MASDDDTRAGWPERRPSRADDDADGAKWGEDDDRDRPIEKRGRSGGVTTVGILAIILGCWVLIGAVCVSVLPALMTGLFDFAAQVNPNDPNIAKGKEAMEKIPSWYIYGSAAVGFLRAMGLLVGGIGVLRRSNGARILTLIMAGLGVVMFLLGVAGNFAFGNMDNPENVAGGVCGLACSAVLEFGFAILAFVFLLGKGSAEFKS